MPGGGARQRALLAAYAYQSDASQLEAADEAGMALATFKRHRARGLEIAAEKLSHMFARSAPRAS